MLIFFVLKLTCDKYFIGHTYKRDFVLSDFNQDKLEWTKNYKPLEVIEIIEDNNFENMFTTIYRYVEIFGVKNVYSTIEPTVDYCDNSIIIEDVSKYYEKMNKNDEKMISSYTIKMLNNSCVLCGSMGHIVADCTNFDCRQENEDDLAGFDSIELGKNDDMEMEMEMEMEIGENWVININSASNEKKNEEKRYIEKLNKETYYYYNLSCYWYQQMNESIKYYENYIYQLYNNHYNYIQM